MKQKARVKERPNKTIEVYNTVDKRYFTQVQYLQCASQQK